MKYTYYPVIESNYKKTEWVENLKAIALAIVIGGGTALLLVYQLSK